METLDQQQQRIRSILPILYSPNRANQGENENSTLKEIVFLFYKIFSILIFSLYYIIISHQIFSVEFNLME